MKGMAQGGLANREPKTMPKFNNVSEVIDVLRGTER
jgi:hypothetical protein